MPSITRCKILDDSALECKYIVCPSCTAILEVHDEIIPVPHYCRKAEAAVFFVNGYALYGAEKYNSSERAERANG